MRPENNVTRSLSISGFAMDILIIVALASVAELTVDPRGDFPLRDDWSYGRAAQIMADTISG